MNNKAALISFLTYLAATALTCSAQVSGYQHLSDTIDVKHHSIALDVRDFDSQQIKGEDEITLAITRNKVKYIPLQLLGMHIDKVSVNGKDIPLDKVQYNDTLLRIPVRHALKRGKQVKVKVAYHGSPVGRFFGGFRWFPDQRMAHNMGASIDDIPHSFARCWFPAEDEFNEHATFDFTYTVPEGLSAIGNGTLEAVDTLQDGSTTWHWVMRDAVPEYLVNVAVGDYRLVHMQAGDVPIDIYVTPDEVEAAKDVYSIIPAAVKSLESHFGPYAFERVGYVTVNSPHGATEHACNISIPRIPSNIPDYRQTAIHELIHQWFGNLVTCATAEDMWLNEGITSYMVEVVMEDLIAEGLLPADMLTDYQHGIDVSAQSIKPGDPDYHAIAGMPQKYTYGILVYRKGAWVTRQLRHFMGDEAFFKGMRSYIDTYKHGNATTEDLKATLEKSSGLDLTAFFDQYIYN